MEVKPHSECAYHLCSDVCSTDKTLRKMNLFYEKKTGHQWQKNNKSLISELQKLLHVDSESGILANKEFCNFIGESECSKEKKERFLPFGPRNTTELINSEHINESLYKLSMKYSLKSKYQKKHIYIPFQMIDFVETGAELSTINFVDAKKKGYNSMGVIINTDVSSGAGKHWFCIFWDGSGAGTQDDPWRIEFFNSSGNPPRPQIQKWFHNLEISLYRDHKITIILDIVCPYRLQNDKHSCGVYCIAYIYFRLHGGTAKKFIESGINDTDMHKFRKFIFRHYQ